ncbi:hypothetical protein HD806DRAFT_508037 [Xylariaceae sp. AK1471]|nr:hypothetical protein HD806DRAFT_508037 [Xylariaceae sp. AK1471]
MIRKLQDLVYPDSSTAVSAFLHDASWFILSFRQIIDLYPLQIYSSTSIFTPMKSMIRRMFQDYI